MGLVLEGFTDISAVLRSGIYLLGHRGEIVYVGQSKSMYSRIYSHRHLWNQSRRGKAAPSWLPSSVKGMLFDEVYICPCPMEGLNELERALIGKYRPKYNTVHKPPGPAQALRISVGGIILTAQVNAAPRLERRI